MWRGFARWQWNWTQRTGELVGAGGEGSSRRVEAEEALMAERAGSDRKLRHPAHMVAKMCQTVVAIRVQALEDATDSSW